MFSPRNKQIIFSVLGLLNILASFIPPFGIMPVVNLLIGLWCFYRVREARKDEQEALLEMLENTVLDAVKKVKEEEKNER